MIEKSSLFDFESREQHFLNVIDEIRGVLIPFCKKTRITAIVESVQEKSVFVMSVSTNPKMEEKSYRSPTNSEQAHSINSLMSFDDIDNDLSPESLSTISRKESHRASERVCVFLCFNE